MVEVKLIYLGLGRQEVVQAAVHRQQFCFADTNTVRAKPLHCPTAPLPHITKLLLPPADVDVVSMKQMFSDYTFTFISIFVLIMYIGKMSIGQSTTKANVKTPAFARASAEKTEVASILLCNSNISVKCFSWTWL